MEQQFIKLLEENKNEKIFITAIEKAFPAEKVVELFRRTAEQLNAQRKMKIAVRQAQYFQAYCQKYHGNQSEQTDEANFAYIRAIAATKKVENLSEAVKLLKKGIANPRLAYMHNLYYGELGYFYHESHRFDKAETYLSRALQLAEQKNFDNYQKLQELAPLYNNLGITFIYLKKFKKAKEVLNKLQKVVEEAGIEGENRKNYVNFQFGSLYIMWFRESGDKKHYELSKQSYEKILLGELDKSDYLYLQSNKKLGDLYVENKNVEAAAAQYAYSVQCLNESSMKLEGGSFFSYHIYRNYLNFLLETGNWQEGIALVADIERQLKKSKNKSVLTLPISENLDIPLYHAEIFYTKLRLLQQVKQKNDEQFQESCQYLLKVCEHFLGTNSIEDLNEIFSIYRNTLLINWEFQTQKQQQNLEKTYASLIWSKALLTRHTTNLKQQHQQKLLQQKKELRGLNNQLLDTILTQNEVQKIETESKLSKLKIDIHQLLENTTNYALIKFDNLVGELQKTLKEDEIFLDFYSADKALFVVIIQKNHHSFKRLSISKKELNQLIEAFLEALCNYELDDEEFIETQILLSEKLIRPLFENIKKPSETKRLSIIVDELIGQLPIGLLLHEQQALDANWQVELYFSTYAFLEKKRKTTQHRASQQKNWKLNEIAILQPQYTNMQHLEAADGEITFLLKKSAENEIETQILASNNKDKILETIDDKTAFHISSHLEESYITGKLEPVIPLRSNATESQHFLFLNDINHANCEQLDFVYLNCCSANSGKNIVGEGLQSFSTVFVKAGAQNVVHTVVKVYDKNAQLFSEIFYAHFYKIGDASAALWQAKKQLIQAGHAPNVYGSYQIMIA